MFRKDFQVHFIIGVEGSGTTMTSRIFSHPNECEVLLGNHISLEQKQDNLFQRFTGLKSKSVSQDILTKLEQSTALMWSRKSDHWVVNEAKQNFIKTLQEFSEMQEYAQVQKVFLKRSAPFYTGDEYRPDLFDIVDLFPDSRILIMLRDPRASSYSALRRRFMENIRYSAIVCEEQLLLMETRLKRIDKNKFKIVNYESFCENPEDIISDVADFFGLNSSEMIESVRRENVRPGKNDAWRQKLEDDQVEFLDSYFDDRCMSQFELLQFRM